MCRIAFFLFFFVFSISHAQVEFYERNIVAGNGLNSSAKLISVDFDNDGDIDLITPTDEELLWYENKDNTDDFERHELLEAMEGFDFTEVKVVDFNNDGYFDLVAPSFDLGVIVWWESDLGNFGAYEVLVNTPGPYMVDLVDIDNDNDLDVFTISGNNVLRWFENLDGNGNLGEQQSIAGNPLGSPSVVRESKLVDFDGDNDLDIVSIFNNGFYERYIVWFENIDGLGSFSSAQQIQAIEESKIATIDLTNIDGDNFLDIVLKIEGSNGWGKIVWHKNIDNQGGFGSEQIINNSFGYDINYDLVSVYDLDQDGDMDILSGSGFHLDGDASRLRWQENLDGAGNFGEENIIEQYFEEEGQASYLNFLDVDDDNNLDIVCFLKRHNTELIWYKNLDNSGDFSSRDIITNSISGVSSVEYCDLDGDGELDVLASSSVDGKIAWYKKENLQSNYGEQQIILYPVFFPTATGASRLNVKSVDFDNDGDLDVVYGNRKKVVVLENTNGLGDFVEVQVVELTSSNSSSYIMPQMQVVDIDGDSDYDIICNLYDGPTLSNSGMDEIIWIENSNGSLLPPVVIDSTNIIYHFEVADFDGDNDLDLVTSNQTHNKLYWYENLNGLGDFGARNDVVNYAGGPTHIDSYDIDNDGDVDVLGYLSSVNKLAWYENIGGNTLFSPSINFVNLDLTIYEFETGDIDGDGDGDIVFYGTNSVNSNNKKLYWFENLDGQGSFSQAEILTGSSMYSLNLGDYNNDGLMDILLGRGAGISQLENLSDYHNSVFGNVNIDFELNNCTGTVYPMAGVLVTNQTEENTFSTFTLENGSFQLPASQNLVSTSIVPLDGYLSNPESIETDFTNLVNANVEIDFCVEPIDVFNDLTVSIYPLNQARPGFQAEYRVVYKNLGTTQLNGEVDIMYDSSKIQFNNSSESINFQGDGHLSLDYSSFNPFEIRTVDLTFDVFTPPVTQLGDVLSFFVEVSPGIDDVTASNNTYQFNQVVVDSYDPNDIQVLEGSQIFYDDVDEYLHYIIRFQNIGTANAINVKVNLLIDDKLDWTTLQLESMSHSGIVNITNGNNVEFNFQNIDLPGVSDEENSHGFIAYKIRPKDNVDIGDIMSAVADIFFDFNSAIVTNTVETEIIDALSLEDFDFNDLMFYPNPVNNSLYIKSSEVVKFVRVYDLNGRIVLEKSFLESLQSVHEVEMKSVSKGMYFAEVQFEDVSVVRKLIKN